MAVVTALPLRKHCWLLVSAIHFICCVPLGPCPRDLVGISPQHPLATEGDRRETSENYAVEKSPPYLRYFLSQINPFRMNWWTSYVLQENKLDPLSRMNGYEHYSCRNFPGHSGNISGKISSCLLLPFLHAEGTVCCQESFWLSFPRLGLGIWVPGDHVFSWGPGDQICLISQPVNI